MLEAKAKCSPKKKGLQKIFSGGLQKKNFSSDLHEKTFSQKIFQALHKILTIQKIVLSSSRGQANFQGLGASKAKDLTFEAKAKDFKMCPRGRRWGQGRPRGLQLWS